MGVVNLAVDSGTITHFPAYQVSSESKAHQPPGAVQCGCQRPRKPLSIFGVLRKYESFSQEHPQS